ncbi:hypothetical protein BDZ97DRAFT_1912937 [Flammula alnicola]|nr:hypothetical protein BDZ97DRAFT_1912937 [Flammula alnicola]
MLSCPHYMDMSYLQYFALWADSQLEECAFEPSVLYLSGENKLIMYVDKIPANHQTSSRTDEALPNINIPRTDRSTDPTTEWLQEQLGALPTYAQFQEYQCCRGLQNSDILEDWKFTSSFYNRYYKSVCNITQKSITRLAVQVVLGIGKTSMSDALVAGRLAVLYSSGGPHESANVVQELQTVRDPPLGKSALLNFLESWEVAHPII